MKLHFSFVGLLGLLFFLTAGTRVLHAQMSKDQLQELYVKYLREEGYLPKVDEDGDVQFKREGFTYFISVNENDLEFFGLMLPNIWEIASDEERLYALFACNEATANTKVAKAQVVGDNVWISAEIFLERPEDFSKVLDRIFMSMDTALDTFVETMQKLSEN